jgi:hypothetical protein
LSSEAPNFWDSFWRNGLWLFNLKSQKDPIQDLSNLSRAWTRCFAPRTPIPPMPSGRLCTLRQTMHSYLYGSEFSIGEKRATLWHAFCACYFGLGSSAIF